MKSKFKTFKVKSKTDKFPEFEIKDDGLGYLAQNIEEYIYEKFKINTPWSTVRGYENILVKPPSEKNWFRIENKVGSSSEILVEDIQPKVLEIT